MWSTRISSRISWLAISKWWRSQKSGSSRCPSTTSLAWRISGLSSRRILNSRPSFQLRSLRARALHGSTFSTSWTRSIQSTWIKSWTMRISRECLRSQRACRDRPLPWLTSGPRNWSQCLSYLVSLRNFPRKLILFYVYRKVRQDHPLAQAGYQAYHSTQEEKDCPCPRILLRVQGLEAEARAPIGRPVDPDRSTFGPESQHKSGCQGRAQEKEMKSAFAYLCLIIYEANLHA